MRHELLPQIINMSITGGIVIIVVLLIRLLLKRAPKVFSYALWVVVLFRLLCPLALPSSISIFTLFDAPRTHYGSLEYIPEDIVQNENPIGILPMADVNESVNSALLHGQEQVVADSPEPMPAMSAATYIWLVGVTALLLYSVIKLFRLRRKLIGSCLLRENIYLADHIASPFVIGIFRPSIYLPSTLSDREREYIILHEQHHIRRFDHIVKLLAFLALCIHWFNPLVWVAFFLSGADMEMSCDEAVIKNLSCDVREEYSRSLLSLASGRRLISGTSLAFGEGDTRARIKNILQYKKPARWIIAVVVVALLVVMVCLLTNPPHHETNNIPSDGTISNPEEKINPSGSATSDILDDVYLGMTEEEVYALFGEPDFHSPLSSSSYYGYNDVGIFAPGFRGTISIISIGGKNWNVDELVNEAINDRLSVNVGRYLTESHRIMKLSADKNGFTAEVQSVCGIYGRKGDYDVELKSSTASPIRMTFVKNEHNDYEFSSYHEGQKGEEWGWKDDAVIESLQNDCYTNAMYHFVGAIPYDGRFGIGVGTVALTNVAQDDTKSGFFTIKYFPGATLQIEKYTDVWAAYEPQTWIIEYSDKRKNITVGKEGSRVIPVTDDLIGIFNVDENEYSIKFEKYTK